MEAIEIYSMLNEEISSAVEVFQCIPKYEPINKGHHEAISPIQTIVNSLHGRIGIFGSQLHLLKELIRDHCKIQMPGTNSKQDLIDYLNAFQANKEAIISGFDSIIGHPQKAFQYGYNEFDTYEAMLLSREKRIKEMSKDIQEQLEKLILLLDSQSY